VDVGLVQTPDPNVGELLNFFHNFRVGFFFLKFAFLFFGLFIIKMFKCFED
jgi:hypothetical protein